MALLICRTGLLALTAIPALAGVAACGTTANTSSSATASSAAVTPGAPSQSGHLTDVVATINISGSTNTRATVVSVYSNGTATVQSASAPRQPVDPRSAASPAAIAQASLTSFLQVLQQVGNVAAIPAGRCAKSASFGTTITVTYQGKTSPDLTCLGTTATAPMQQVAALATTIGQGGP